MANLPRRDQVFFSYSHKDKKWLELFQVSLKPLIRANQFSVWDDTKIRAGDIWREEIKQALASAKVAVLLVSMNFLNSDFIAENELPPLLEAAQNEGLKILMVIVGHSLFDETELGRYQAINDLSRPLASITAASREKEIVRICREIKAVVTSSHEVKSDTNKQTEDTTSRQPANYLTVDAQTPTIGKSSQSDTRAESRQDRLSEAENNAWASALRMNTIYGYQSFLSKFPNSHHAIQAYQAIQIKETNLQHVVGQRVTDRSKHFNEQFEKAWQVALKENSILAYRDFLEAYPNSKYSGQAKIQLSLLEDHFKEKS